MAPELRVPAADCRTLPDAYASCDIHEMVTHKINAFPDEYFRDEAITIRAKELIEVCYMRAAADRKPSDSAHDIKMSYVNVIADRDLMRINIA
jgi:hypothetical protein